MSAVASTTPSEASAQAGERLRRAHARDAAATLVADLHRLVKLAQLHALDNQAVVRQLEATHAALREYTLRAGEPATVFFARGLVFVGSEPLKGSRGAYEAAAELAGFLARAGGNELVFAPDVTPTDLRAFVDAVVGSLRGARAQERPSGRVLLRAVPEGLARGVEVEALEADQRVVRAYASAVVVMRRFLEALERGELAMPRRIKRIAQTLVDLSSGRTPAFLGVTAVRNANHDEAGRAVNTAILAVAMGRQVTSDPVVLARLAMSALMLDVGRPRARRAMRIEGDDAPIVARLSDAAERTLPAGTAAVLTALGRVNEPTIVRTVVAYEALSLGKGVPREPLYRGVRPATLHARIVAVARAYNDLLTPEPGAPEREPEQAIHELGAHADAAERTAIRLLSAALGVVPKGTMIELSTGEIAVVVATEAGRPRLRIVVDAEGGIPSAAHAHEVVLGSDARTAIRIVGSDPSYATAPSVAPPPPPPPAPAPAPAPAPERSPITTDDAATVISSSPLDVEPSPSPPEVLEPIPVSAPAALGRIALVRRATIPPMKAPPSSRGGPPPRSGSIPPPPPAAAPPPSVRPAAPSPFGLVLPTSAPDVRGTLARSPLPHLLVHVLTRGLTGSLVLRETETAVHAIVFRDGAPTKAHALLRGPRLGDLLVARGDLAQPDVAEVVSRARTSMRPLGKQLVAEGKLGAAQIASALEEQLDARVAELATLAPDTTYLFYDGHDILPTRDAHGFDPLPRILVATRSWRDEGASDAALAKLGETPIALHALADLERFRPTEEERIAVEWGVAGGFGYRALLAEEIAAPEAVRAILWSLLATRHLVVGEGHTPLGVRPPPVPLPMAPPPPPEDDPGRPSFTSLPAPAEGVPSVVIVPAAPAPISTRGNEVSIASALDHRAISAPGGGEGAHVRITEAVSDLLGADDVEIELAEDEPKRRAIVEREAALGSLDAYALLGVDERADAAAIQRAYLDAAKTFHPDRLPSDLSDLKDRAAKVFAAVTEARDTLLDPAKRAAHDTSRREGVALGAERSEVERVLEASTNFQKAEVMLRRNDVAAAERFAALAAEGDPGTPEHLGLHGYLLAMRGGPDATVRAVELLDRAAAHDDASDKVLFWRGSVRKKLGNLEGAIRDFRAAAEKNPKNLDAVREVRVWEMRAAKREVAKKSLLSGLFGRKRS